jgi:hypothetical protein
MKLPKTFLSILWKPKVHYRVYKSPPLVSVLNQIIPVHTSPSHLSQHPVLKYPMSVMNFKRFGRKRPGLIYKLSHLIIRGIEENNERIYEPVF